MRTIEEIERIKYRSSGGLAQKDRENLIIDLLVEIRDLLDKEGKK